MATCRQVLGDALDLHSSPISCSFGTEAVGAFSCGTVVSAKCRVVQNSSKCRQYDGTFGEAQGKSLVYVQVRLALHDREREARTSTTCKHWSFHFGVRNVYTFPASADIDARQEGNSATDFSTFRFKKFNHRNTLLSGKNAKRSMRKTRSLRPDRLLANPGRATELHVAFSSRATTRNRVKVGMCVVHESLTTSSSAEMNGKSPPRRDPDRIRGSEAKPNKVVVEILPFPGESLNCWSCEPQGESPQNDFVVPTERSENSTANSTREQAVPHAGDLLGANSSNSIRDQTPNQPTSPIVHSQPPGSMQRPTQIPSSLASSRSAAEMHVSSSSGLRDDDLTPLWTGARLYLTLFLILLVVTFSTAFFYLLWQTGSCGRAEQSTAARAAKPWPSMKLLKKRAANLTKEGCVTAELQDRLRRTDDVLKRPTACVVERHLSETDDSVAPVGESSLEPDAVHYEVTTVGAGAGRTTPGHTCDGHYQSVDTMSQKPDDLSPEADTDGEYAMLSADSAPISSTNQTSQQNNRAYEHVYDLPPTKDGRLLSMATKSRSSVDSDTSYIVPSRKHSAASNHSADVERRLLGMEREVIDEEERDIYKSLTRDTNETTGEGASPKSLQKQSESYVALYRSPKRTGMLALMKN